MRPKLVEHAVDREREGDGGEQRGGSAATLVAHRHLRRPLRVAPVLHRVGHPPEVVLAHLVAQIAEGEERAEAQRGVHDGGDGRVGLVLHVVQPRVPHRELVLVAQHRLLHAQRELAVEEHIREQRRREVMELRRVLLLVELVEHAVLELDDEAPLVRRERLAQPLLQLLCKLLHVGEDVVVGGRARRPVAHLRLLEQLLGERRARLWVGGEVIRPRPLRPVLQPVHRLRVLAHVVELRHRLERLAQVRRVGRHLREVLF